MDTHFNKLEYMQITKKIENQKQIKDRIEFITMLIEERIIEIEKFIAENL